MTQMGTNWPRVAGLTNPAWDHADNGQYRQTTELSDRIKTAFPLRLDMGRISACKQKEDETDSLTRLTEVHTTHSGLQRPNAMGGTNPITPWEAHLRDRFINGIKPEISEMVKRYCITWDCGILETVERHAIHSEKYLNDKKRKKSAQTRDRLQMAQLMVYERQAKRGRKGRGRRTPRGRGRGGSDACFKCEKLGHLAKNCPDNDKQAD